MRSRTFALHPGALISLESHRVRRIFVLLVASVLAVLPYVARADDDLPGRVGRIAEFAGQLFLAPQDRATEWSVIGINYPVTSGDNLFVSVDGRAEIDYGGGQFRLAGDTNLHVSRLDDRQLALFVAQGRLIVRVRVLDTGDAAWIDTPNTQVTLTRPGLYRIDVAPDGQGTTVAVREGEAVIALTSGAQQALPGQSVTVTGPEPASADVRNSFGSDGFDTWSADRDRRYERGRSTAYVSRQMVGYAELDEYGTWETSPTYGPVWYPTAVAADWTPYRDGYWANVGGWGLTWVDAAPWGYAPSHYGRWVRVGPRWGWCPGRFVARPYWAPALVGWYGGAGWAVSVSGGAPVYGWVPLGWGDAYIPWWRRCSNNCWTHYNRPFAVNVTVRPTAPPARYSNFGVPGAMTVVAGATLATRKPVPANIVPLPGSLATSAPALASAPPVAPGPSPAPGIRHGERGTPPPASSFYPRTWPGGRDAAGPAPKAGSAPAVPRGTGRTPTTPQGGLSGAPSTFAPPPRPGDVAGPSPAQTPGPRPGVAPVGPSGAASAQQGIPPPSPGRRGAPASPAPEAGGAVVAVPPVQPGTTPHVRQPRPAGPSGQPVPPTPTQQQGSGRAGNPPTVGPATGSPGTGGLGAGGLPPPPPRSGSAPAPAPAGRAVPAPAPTGRAAPAPSVAPPGAAPGAPLAPAPQGRADPKPSDAGTAAGGKAVEKGNPGAAGTAPR